MTEEKRRIYIKVALFLSFVAAVIVATVTHLGHRIMLIWVVLFYAYSFFYNKEEKLTIRLYYFFLFLIAYIISVFL